MERAQEQHGLTERHACRLLGQWRGTQRYESIQRDDEDELTAAVIALASQYGRYGYKKIIALLQRAGWSVGRDRVERIWRREGLKVPKKQRPRSSVTLAIELKNESRLIGTIRLSIKDESNLTGDFGFALNRYYLNQGYATEAARAIVDVAFQQLGLHRIWAGCDTNNHASSRVMEKLGMRREALFRKEVLQKGEWRDSFLYTVLAEEWLGFARQEAEK